MRLLLAASVLLALVAPSFGADLKMTCKNPGHGYEVDFDPKARTLILDPDTTRTAYLVLAVEGQTVVGMVGHDSGLGFAADFAKRRITFYSNETVAQIDNCGDAGL